MYDIVGDIHGHAELLKKMLTGWGYIKSPGGYYHPERKVVFTGDFINRGPEIRKTVKLIRNMVENGNALAIAGNHEINAIQHSLKAKIGDKKLTDLVRRNDMAHFKTLDEFSKFPDEWKSHLKWMRTLPFFIETENIRIVHACWADEAVEVIRQIIPPGKIKKRIYREIQNEPGSVLSKNINILTKGVDFVFPHDLKVMNNKGTYPRSFRLRWWEDPRDRTFEEMSFESKFELPAISIPKELTPSCFVYPDDAPLLFFGHYCRYDGPFVIKANLCCVDSCVAGSKVLTGYRWEGETSLDEGNLVQITY